MLNVFITNPTNPDELWEIQTDEVKWDEQLNAIKSGSFSVPFQAMKAQGEKLGVSVGYIFRGGKRKVMISDSSYKDDPVLFVGWLRDYQFSSSTSEPSTISVNFADLGVMLSKRVGQDYAFYDQVPAAEIFQAELEAAQSLPNGDMGLTLSPLPTTTSRQRTVERTNLLDLLTGMSSSKTKGGFDFDVDKNGVIHIYQPRGVVQENIVFDERNSQQPQVAGKLMSNLANKVYVQGGDLTDADGNVTQEAIQVVVEDTQAQELWGLHEEYVSATDIATEPFLLERGRQVLADQGLPVNTETITLQHLGDDPDWRSYNVGDLVRVDLPDFEINELLRVRKRSIQYTKGVYKISLSVFREELPND